MEEISILNGLEIADKTARENMIIKPPTAEIGQMLIVKAVDENGVPTEWEVVDSYTKQDIDAKLTSYIDDVAILIGGDA